MVEIPVTERFRVVSDPHCWVVQERRGNYPDDHKHHPGAPKWEGLTFHPSLPSALDSLRERRLRTAEICGLEEAIAEYRRITQHMLEALGSAMGDRTTVEQTP